ncbi:MAG TPA: hypothetical protein VN765_09825, partial [Candidatus Acidoferrum sp.]|nr:hypothetical protein [Candidatus Acidoferrum sp.]
MKPLNRCSVALLALQIGMATLSARQILIQPQGRGATAVNGISNVRVGKLSDDGTDLELTVDVTYDGMRGPNVRVVPIISDAKKPQVSRWFGAETKVVGQGKVTISIKVKFFNDEPGVPPELTTDRIRLMMLSESGNSVVSENPVIKTIKWGNPNFKPAPLAQSAPTAADEAKAAQLAADKKAAEDKARADELARIQKAEEDRLAKVAADKKAAEDKAKADELARIQKAEQDRLAKVAADKKAAEDKARADELARIQKAEEDRLAKVAADKKAA